MQNMVIQAGYGSIFYILYTSVITFKGKLIPAENLGFNVWLDNGLNG